MDKSLSDETVALVKATVPALEAHGVAITRRMYERMFEDPAIRALFDQSHHGETGSQPTALALAILAYARNIDNLGAVGGAVERIAQKHVGLDIRPAHYPAVATALLAAIEDVLGAAATPAILRAWGEAYWFLAETLIGRETHLYADQAATPGGWTGSRGFVVAAKVPESETVTSFHLAPADGGPVARHRAGQYLTFRLELPGARRLTRHYSISSAPDDRFYRITVKREPRGAASSWLHDVATVGTRLEVAPPAGDFFLPAQPERPVVLLSGGVGLTPMVSMLEAARVDHPALPVHFVHGTLSGATHALGARTRALAAASAGTVRTTIFYQSPRPEDRLGESHDAEGIVTLDWLRTNTPMDGADYYLCGPRAFLRAFVSGLLERGVPATRLHYEFFGPADELLAA